MNIFGDVFKIVTATVQASTAIASVPVKLISEPIHEASKAAVNLSNDIKRACK